MRHSNNFYCSMYQLLECLMITLHSNFTFLHTFVYICHFSHSCNYTSITNPQIQYACTSCNFLQPLAYFLKFSCHVFNCSSAKNNFKPKCLISYLSFFSKMFPLLGSQSQALAQSQTLNSSGLNFKVYVLYSMQ